MKRHRFIKSMRRTLLYSFLLFTVWLLLAQCFIMRNRWSDKKAYKIFKAKDIPLTIFDTVINQNHLHYAVCGSDTLPTLVFIHGSPGSWMNYVHYMWDTAMRKKFRIIAIDRPGFGYSSFGKALHLQEQCEIIMPVLQKLKTNKPMFLAGHSMGGPVAAQLAANNSTLFKSVVLLSASIDINQEAKENWRKVMGVKPFYWLLPGAFGPSNTELLYLKKDLLPLQNDLHKITCPVIFIHGDKDNWVPIENIAFGKKMMTNATVTSDTLFGANHFIPWKRMDEVKSVLLQLN
jgi:pimeloyl-ACP methyl ester carboxylesterase